MNKNRNSSSQQKKRTTINLYPLSKGLKQFSISIPSTPWQPIPSLI